jgi:hypothetical protein
MVNYMLIAHRKQVLPMIFVLIPVLYLDTGVEHRYLYFDRVDASFSENSLGIFAALDLI